MADIGTTLRETRMRARIDITEVERATKIRARYLRAMEHEEWEALPGPVYVKSFLRTYGDYLGLDSRVLVDDYKRRYERPSDHEPRTATNLRRERERAARGPLLPSWAVIGLVLVAVVVALYLLGSHKSKSPPPTTAARPPATTTKVTTHSSHRTRPAAPRTVTLQIIPTGRVYVCLTDGGGKVLIPGVIYNPGQAVPTHTASALLLTLGNNAVHLKANHKTVPVPASAASIGLKLGPTSTRPLPTGQQPRCA
jgi:cytoskeletal protein RodZ